MISQINGACVPADAAGAGPVIGLSSSGADVVGGATDGAVRTEVWTDRVFVMPAGVNAPTDATPFGTPLYAEDANHVGIGPGTVLAGRFMGIEDNGDVRCFMSNNFSWFDGNANDGGTAAYKARAVITSLANGYTGSGTGTLTGTANAALGNQDGVAVAVGDVVFLPAGISHATAAKDAGPYVISQLGSGTAPFILTRPVWWQTGDVAQLGQAIDIGGEGAIWGGNAFKVMAAKGSTTIDTNDLALYPKTFRKTVTLASGTYTLGAGGGGEALFLLDTTHASVQLSMNTGAGTLGTNKLGAPAASRVAGYPGTAAIVINSYVDADTVAGSDTSTVDVLVTNY